MSLNSQGVAIPEHYCAFTRRTREPLALKNTIWIKNSGLPNVGRIDNTRDSENIFEVWTRPIKSQEKLLFQKTSEVPINTGLHKNTYLGSVHSTVQWCEQIARGLPQCAGFIRESGTEDKNAAGKCMFYANNHALLNRPTTGNFPLYDVHLKNFNPPVAITPPTL
jgi:hypothetical protein